MGVTLSGSVKPKLARFSPASKGCKWVSASVPVTPPSTPALGPKTLSILLGLAAASVSLATHSPNWDVVPAPSPGWVRVNKPAALAAARIPARVSALLSVVAKCVAAKSAQVSRKAINSGDKDSGMNGSYRLGAMVNTTMASMASTIKAMA